ncbi:MAG: M24 family metallopeptidase [Patescibacteria group bacterium]|mgnify:CR=1 FL=1
MPWTKKQISQHIRAAKELSKIKDEFFSFLKPGVSEYEAVEFLRKKYKEHGLWSVHAPIVAFGQNTSFVHYFPSQYSRRLRRGDLILLDIWARVREVGAPFADMTWMGCCGSFTSYDLVHLIFRARDASIRFLRSRVREGVVPRGREVDAVARGVLEGAGYGKYFLHGLGHPLGFRSPHGTGARLSQKKGEGALEKRVGYTIEPGVYLKNKFGARSEIDFYIDGKEVVITTPVQKTITKI